MSDSNSFAMDFDPSRQLVFTRRDDSMIDPPLLRVYLASPLTNAEPDTEQDRRMVRAVTKAVLEDYDYLGIRFELYDPGEFTAPGSDHKSEEVYVTDHNRVGNVADLVIFHVNCPSLGVGMEAQIAADATVPRVVVSKQGVSVSRMFLGAFSPTVAPIRYLGKSDYEAQLTTLLPIIAKATLESAQVRRNQVAEFSNDRLGQKIFKQRILRKITIDELARLVDIREFWLRRLERVPNIAANLTLIQLHRIASATNCSASISPSGTTTLKIGDAELPKSQQKSLDNLVEFVLSQPDWLPDEQVFRLWYQYVEEQEEETAEAIRHRSNPENQVTVEEWKKRYSSLGLF